MSGNLLRFQAVNKKNKKGSKNRYPTQPHPKTVASKNTTLIIHHYNYDTNIMLQKSEMVLFIMFYETRTSKNV